MEKAEYLYLAMSQDVSPERDTGEKGELLSKELRSGETQMKLPSDWLEQLKSEYPQRYGPQGWLRVRTILPQSISAGATWEQILSGTRAYREYCLATGSIGTQHVKSASTFFDYRTQGWTEDYAPPQKPQSAAEQKLNARWEQLKARALSIGFRSPMAVESCDVFETFLKRAEREQPSPVQNVVSLLARDKSIRS